MAVVATQQTIVNQEGVIKLSRYAQLVMGGYSECAVFGVRKTGDDLQNQCFRPWFKDTRDNVIFYLKEAQEEIEDEIGYFLEPTWVVGTLAAQTNGDGRFIDDQKWRIPVLSKWVNVIAGGVRGETTIVSGTAVDHGTPPSITDPAVVGPVVTTVTDPDEIHVFYPGTDTEINPSSITISGGSVTILIPRCRMVKEEFADNNENGVDYEDTNNFQATVDIKRIYNDVSTNATLVQPHKCSLSCASTGCSEFTQSGCIYIRNPVIGTLDVQPATFSSGAWVTQGLNRCSYQRVRLNYYSGVRQLSKQAQDAIRMLAHSKMPSAPCGCDRLVKMWDADHEIPSVLTRERINCPFGLSNGAWIAYKFSQRMKTVRMGTF